MGFRPTEDEDTYLLPTTRELQSSREGKEQSGGLSGTKHPALKEPQTGAAALQDTHTTVNRINRSHGSTQDETEAAVFTEGRGLQLHL